MPGLLARDPVFWKLMGSIVWEAAGVVTAWTMVVLIVLSLWGMANGDPASLAWLPFFLLRAVHILTPYPWPVTLEEIRAPRKPYDE